MADYKEIIGLDVEAKSANPTNVITGEIWFNTLLVNYHIRKQMVQTLGQQVVT